MNKRRLLKLADLLEADAKNPKGIKFDLGTWAQTKGDEVSVSCGTSACAMGLAALSGAFVRAGLTYEVEEAPEWTGARFAVVVRHGEHADCYAAASLFDIDSDVAEWLFLPDWYEGAVTGKRGELKVAKRIRDFVAGKARP